MYPMNICDLLLARTHLVSASCARQLSDMLDGKDAEFVRDCYFFCKEFQKAIVRGERMIEFPWYNRLGDKIVKRLVSLGYVVEKYSLKESCLLERLPDDTSNDKANYWIVRWE